MARHGDSDRFDWRVIEDQPRTADDWQWAIPTIMNALNAEPGTPIALPRPPDEHSDHRQSLGYWHALHYLLLYRLGWSRPGKGLRWWIDADMPLDDPTLRLVSTIWDQDGRLEEYVAWSIRHPWVFLDADKELGYAVGDASPISPAWKGWEQSHTPLAIPFGISGGSDPLHLSGHGQTWGRRDPLARLTVSDTHSRSASFAAVDPSTWYYELLTRSRGLPDVSPNSWHIDVRVETLGHVGTYRRSRVTGLMFTGKHSVHVEGN